MSTPEFDEYTLARHRLSRKLRVWLVAVGLGLVAVFSAAAWIRPYDDAGRPLRMASHTQLGLDECSFVEMTGKPCPSCGMTTSFSLLVHGDPVNSARANWVGMLLAAFCLALLPWMFISAWRGRPWLVFPRERSALVIGGGFAVLALLRWGVMMAPSLFD